MAGVLAVVREEFRSVTAGQRWTIGLSIGAVVLFVCVGLPTSRLLPNDTITGSLTLGDLAAPVVVPTAAPDPLAEIPFLIEPRAGDRAALPEVGDAPRAVVTPPPTSPASAVPTPTPSSSCSGSLPIPSPIPLTPGLPFPVPAPPVPAPDPVCALLTAGLPARAPGP